MFFLGQVEHIVRKGENAASFTGLLKVGITGMWGPKGSKFKAFADEKLNVIHMVKFILNRKENSMGKGENDVFKRLLSQGPSVGIVC